MDLLHLKAGEYSVSLSYSVLRTDKYHNVRVRVDFLRGLHFAQFRSTYFSASVTGTLRI